MNLITLLMQSLKICRVMLPSLRWFTVIALILGSFGVLLVLSTTLNGESILHGDNTDTQPGIVYIHAVITVSPLQLWYSIL